MLPRGFSKTPEYAVWRSIKDRCTSPKHATFEYYGGRGITFSPRWSRFENFLADVGPRPSPAHSIDRYPDNDGNYCPTNVRWATRHQQQTNTRRTKFVVVRGEALPLVVAADRAGFNRETVKFRVRSGWTKYDAVSIPVRKKVKISPDVRAGVRAAKGTQREIAERFGISPTAVSEIRSGTKRTRAKGGVR